MRSGAIQGNQPTYNNQHSPVNDKSAKKSVSHGFAYSLAKDMGKFLLKVAAVVAVCAVIALAAFAVTTLFAPLAIAAVVGFVVGAVALVVAMSILGPKSEKPKDQTEDDDYITSRIVGKHRNPQPEVIPRVSDRLVY